MKELINKRALLSQRKEGDIYFKLGLFSFDFCGSDYELVGYVMTNDLKEAKKVFFKALEDDEDATIGYYMVISKFEVVKPYIDAETGKQKNIQRIGNPIINDFGKWKDRNKWFKEVWGIEVK